MTTPEFEIRPTILVGDSADISYQRTLTVLRNESVNPDRHTGVLRQQGRDTMRHERG